MLEGTRFKLVQAIGRTSIPTGYKIMWGQIQSRIDPASGVKAQDATLFNEKGKPVAWYYGATDEVRTGNEVLVEKNCRKSC